MELGSSFNLRNLRSNSLSFRRCRPLCSNADDPHRKDIAHSTTSESPNLLLISRFKNQLACSGVAGPPAQVTVAVLCRSLGSVKHVHLLVSSRMRTGASMTVGTVSPIPRFAVVAAVLCLVPECQHKRRMLKPVCVLCSTRNIEIVRGQWSSHRANSEAMNIPSMPQVVPTVSEDPRPRGPQRPSPRVNPFQSILLRRSRLVIMRRVWLRPDTLHQSL